MDTINCKIDRLFAGDTNVPFDELYLTIYHFYISRPNIAKSLYFYWIGYANETNSKKELIQSIKDIFFYVIRNTPEFSEKKSLKKYQPGTGESAQTLLSKINQQLTELINGNDVSFEEIYRNIFNLHRANPDYARSLYFQWLDAGNKNAIESVFCCVTKSISTITH